MLVDIDKIVVDDHTRRNSGDIEELAADIKKNGLISPITINRDYCLVSGLRRYEACKMLKWKLVEVRMVDAEPREPDSVIRMADSKLHVESKWKTEAVRKLLSNPPDTAREPCFICGKHESITVLHHIVQVSELTRMLNAGVIGVEQVCTPVVWLCPNCHRYVHESLRGNFDAVKNMAADDEWWGCFRVVIDARVRHLKKLSGITRNEDGGEC